MSLQDIETPQAAEEQKPAGSFDDGIETPDDSTSSMRVPDSGGDDSALATDEEDQKPKVTFDESQQAKVDEIVNEKVFKQRNAERERDRAQAELADLRSKQPTAERPVIPDLPEDTFADDYKQQMADRDKAIADASAFDARKDEADRAEQSQQQTAQTAQVEQLTKAMTDYSTRAKDAGITEVDLKKASDIVNSIGIDGAVAGHILLDEKGPAITQHLAANISQLEAMRAMTPMQAAVFIETQVKPSLTGKPSSATPDPTTVLNGGASPPGERGPKGATFE